MIEYQNQFIEGSGPRINAKVERNSRGTNYEASVVNAISPEEAVRLLRETTAKLRQEIVEEDGHAD